MFILDKIASCRKLLLVVVLLLAFLAIVVQQNYTRVFSHSPYHLYSKLLRYPAGNATVPKLEMNIKIYVYDLPPKFNKVIEDFYRNHTRYDLSHEGYGDTVASFEGAEFRNTYQGSLDIIFHKRVLASGLVTSDPSKADLFFIPYYEHMTHKEGMKKSHRQTYALQGELDKLPYYRQGKPHLMSNGWVSFYVQGCHCLQIVLEDTWRGVWWVRPDMVIAPYPSYGHITQPNGGEYVKHLHRHERRVFAFIDINDRTQKDYESRKIRHKIYTHITEHTSRSFTEEMSYRNMTDSESLEVINYRPGYTSDQVGKTIEWMQNSVFCVHPPGDTDTRKAFYDSLLCGCIPVLFELPYISHVDYPFENVIDYTEFTVKIPVERMLQYTEVLHEYSKSSIARMQYHMRRVLPYLQYNDISNIHVGDDAFSMIMYQVKTHFNL